MILLTGASGFVGKRVLAHLLEQGQDVVCIARTPGKFTPHKNLHLLKGDLEITDVLNASTDPQLLEKIDRVVHLAALYDLHASSGASYMANVVATTNLLALTRKMPAFKTFYHISTVAVAGNYAGVVPTDEVEFGQDFPNSYAKTKAQAETLLRRALKPEQLCILRPGIIVGDSRTGEFDKADGPYMAIEFFKKLLERAPFLKHLPLYPLPMRPQAQLPLVTVDVVAEIIAQAVLADDVRGCHHLVMPDAPTVGEFAQKMLQYLGYNGAVKYVSGVEQLSKILKRLPPIPSFPAPLLDYMAAQAQYDVTEECRQFPQLKQVQWAEFQELFFRQAMQTL